MKHSKILTSALTLSMLSIGALVTTTESAQAESFSCPTSIHLKSKNTPLGWAATIPSQLFESASIELAGNRQEMHCYYSNNAKLVKTVPLNNNCSVQGDGFKCTAIATAAVEPPVHRRSSFWLSPNQTADLDSGIAGAGNGADVLLGAAGLEGLGSTRFSEISDSGTYTKCSRAVTNNRSIRKSLLKPKTRFCAKLSSGRLTSIVVTKKSGSNVKLAFRTWKQQ